MSNDEQDSLYPRPLSGDRVVPLPSALVPARVKLPGQHVTVEPQNARAHAEELFEAGHGTAEAMKIWDYLAYGPWASVDEFREQLRQQSSSQDTLFYSIRSNQSQKVCGQASYLDIHAANGVIEIGHIWFGPELQRTVGATEALYLMLCHAMDDLGYRRMQWRCNALNAKSRAAARRLGFRFEGIFHNHMIFKGKNRDTAWYSILDDEWPEVKAHIKDWLSPSNFDTAGTARHSLNELMTNRTASTRGVGH